VNVVRSRGQFTFDAHADRLVAFFRSVVEARGSARSHSRGRLGRVSSVGAEH
jgi:hypothetical protein